MQKAIVVGIVTASLAFFLAATTLPSAQASGGQSPKAAKNAAMVQAGQDIFSQRCMQCHSVNEGQVMFGPSLYAEMRKPHGKKSAAEIRLILKNGKGKMPSFEGKLTPEDTDNLLAYLHTL